MRIIRQLNSRESDLRDSCGEERYLCNCRETNPVGPEHSRSRYSDELRAGRPGSIPGGGKISAYFTASRPTLGSTQPPIQWIPVALSSGIKRPGREADHLPPTSAEVKKHGATTPFPICLHGTMLK
jgi:hypothetical protein